MFRLLLRLVNAYISIIFLTVSAPFQFLFAALPGRQGISTNWVLSLLSNVLAFPAVIAVLYFVAFILGSNIIDPNCADPCPFKVSHLNQTENNAFIPTTQAAGGATIVGSASYPLFGGFDVDFIKLLLAFGALVALPAIPDIIQRAMGRVSQAGQLIGQEIGAGTGAGQKYSGQLTSGIHGFAGQVGRLTPETAYMWDPNAAGGKGGYIVNPLQSRAGLTGRVRAKWQMTPGPWYKKLFS